MIKIKQIENLDNRLRKAEKTAQEYCDQNSEPKIPIKRTAFNKDFGVTSDTVAEGNHTHKELREIPRVDFGSGVFNSFYGTSIKFKRVKDNSDYKVSITPTSNSRGTLGEFWVEGKTANEFTVKCSGSTKTTTFDWVVYY